RTVRHRSESRAIPRRSALAGGRVLLAALAVTGVTVEGAGRRKLAELVAHHVLGDEHGHELAAVVDGESQAHGFRKDGGAARPGLDDLLRTLRDRFLDLAHEVSVDERPLGDT